LDCRHVCKTCASHNALQAGKQKEMHRTPLIWCPQAPDQGIRWVCYNERCYNEKFLSIKSGSYNEHRCCYNRGRILSTDVARACE
jgi:hypothetical protein